MAFGMTFALLGAMPAAAALSIEAFASVEAGPAALCAVSSVFLPDIPFSGVYGVPADFQACGFSADSGQLDDVEPIGTATASWSATNTSFSGVAHGWATYGSVGASASGANGYIGNGLGNAAGAFGLFRDTITVTSATHANGTSAYIVFEFAVDGQVAVTNGDFDPGSGPLLGRADAFLAVSIGGTPMNAFRADVNLHAGQLPTTLPPNVPGFGATLEPTGRTIGGSDVVATTTLYAPYIEFGAPTPLVVGMLAEVYPQTQSGALGSASVAFDSTATLVDIQVLDALKQPIADAQVTSESGTYYAPEPVAGAAVVAAVLSLLGVRWREERRRFPRIRRV
jgi:hypothetical protein